MITLGCLLKLNSLKTDNEFNIWFKEADESYVNYTDFISNFGDDRTLFVIYKTENLFSEEELKINRLLTQKLEEIKGVKRVTSLTNMRIPYITPFQVKDRVLLNKNSTDYVKLRKSITDQKIFVNSLVSRDGKATGIQLYTESYIYNSVVLDEARKIIRDLPDSNRYFLVGGIPIFEETSRLSTEEPVFFMAMALFVMFVILLVIMRSLVIAIIPLVLSYLSIIWSMTLLNLLGGSINMLTGIVPLVILVMGVALSIHLISTYREHLPNCTTPFDAICKTYQDVLVPGTITSFTTSIAFFSFSFSQVGPIRLFGISAAAGVIFTYLITLLIMPILFKKYANKFLINTKESAHKLNKFPSRLSHFVIHYRKGIIVTSLLFFSAALIGLTTVKFESDQIKYFNETNPVRIANDSADHWFNGIYPYEIILNIKKIPSDSLITLYNSLALLEKNLANIDGVNGCYSIIGLSDAVYNLNSFKISKKIIFSKLISTSGKNRVHESKNYYVTPDHSRLRIVVKTNWTNNQKALQVCSAIQNELKIAFPNNKIPIYITGTTILLARLSDQLLDIQIFSLGLSFFIIFIVFIIIFRKPRYFIYGILPNILPVVFSIGLMGFLGLPLDVGTVLVASISLGIAVDDSVYFLTAYIGHRNISINSTRLTLSFKRIWRPITLTSFLLSIGFFLLVLSDYTPVRFLGLFVSLNMLVALICDLLLLPALLTYSKE